MGDIGVKFKYLDEYNVELLKKVNQNINNLKDEKLNSEIVSIFEDITNEIDDSVYTAKESKKILISLFYALEIIRENIEKNGIVRQNEFFEEEKNQDSIAKELLEGMIISAKNEYEENKLRYYGYLLGNIFFQNDLYKDESNRLIRIIRTLSYCQIRLINMYVISQTIQVPILKREDYIKCGIHDYKLLGILQDTLDMIQKGILNGSGKLVLDVVQINPSKIKVQGCGTLLYNLMCLNKMPYDELEDLLEILSNK
ncbi:MAG: hypothetical protein RSG52_01620 [Terrisporobacter sp.]|uniref:hypothetical protein n=1 Tax=Terrisporobacter sp. TaxID=1965305 RepID=UPI002FC68D70